MTQDKDQYNAEAILKELQEAQSSGVFAPTPVDAVLDRVAAPREARVVSTRARRGRLRVGGAVLAAAAILLLWMTFRGGFYVAPDAGGASNLLADGKPSGAADKERLSSLKFPECFSGPGVLVDASCRPYDLDGDGDIDLADYHRFQVSATEGARQ